ncbi:MAG TPA: hypothetical protein DIT64_00410 [Verrucomicrobiales bacterium]|nr:hypothetical protein [Verrucomicrobiales bacterium]
MKTRILLGALLPAFAALAQNGSRPVNDGVSNTILISERVGSYAGQGGGKATAEFGETAVGGAPAKNTVWYRYTAPADGRYVVDITDTQGLRAELRFPGNPATTIPLQTLVDGTSNTIFPDTERLSVDLDRGQTVYLVVDAAQPFGFTWRFAEVVNDHWQDAETISSDGGTLIRANSGATRDTTEANLGLAWPGVWFEWTAPSTGAWYFDLVGSRQWDGSTFDGFGLRVYESASGVPSSLVGSGSGSSLDNSTRVAVNATAGHVYFIACDSGANAPDSQLWLSWYEQGSPGVLAWAQSEYRTSEADGAVYPWLLKLRGDGDGSVQFISETVDGTVPAVNGEDFQIPINVLLALGARAEQVPVTILANTTAETEEAFGVTLVNPTGGLGIQDGTSNTILIGEEIDNAACGLAQREVRAREGQTAHIELRRQRAGDRQVAVGWRVRNGTCRAGADMPGLSGTTYLAPGQMSTIIPVPVYRDYVFEGEESFTVELTDSPQAGAIVDGASNTIVIVEDEDFFVPRPGAYCGLLDTEGWGALVKCTVTGEGRASGTVDFRGGTYRFTGGFDARGELVAAFARTSRPSIGLRLRFAEGWARCAASLRDPEGEWADGHIRYLPYSKASPAPQAGRHTHFCEGIGGGSVPVPVTGVSVVSTDGSVRFVSRVADGQSATFASRIGQSDPEAGISGEAAFVAPLYGKTGNLYGTCDFGLGPQQPGGETTLGWLKPWRPKDALYPAMPYQTIACQTVPFTPPPAGQTVTQFTDGSVRFLNSGTLLDGTSNTLLISEKNQVTITEPGNPLGCSIKIDAKTGSFSGKIKPPGSTKFINFYGVMHQGAYNYGLGFFPGDQRAGEVVIADF